MYQHIIERGIVAAIRCRDTKLRVKNTFAFSYFALPSCGKSEDAVVQSRARVTENLPRYTEVRNRIWLQL